MAWIMRKSIVVEDSPMVHWTPESIEEIMKANASVVAQYSNLPMDHPEYIAEGNAPVGHHIPFPNEPREAVLEELLGPLPDALTSSIVNNRIKQAVEAIEPGVHQFIPTILILPDGSRDESWWAMRVCNKVDAIAFDRCADVYKYFPKPDQYPDYYWYRSNSDSRTRLAVYQDRIAGMAMWYDWRFQSTFFSEKLGQYFMDEKIRGYCLPADELKHSSHVIEV